MSDTPKNADAIKRLLDNKWCVLLSRNELGSYTAIAIGEDQTIEDAAEIERQITDDFEPSQVLYRLTEKMIGNIA